MSPCSSIVAIAIPLKRAEHTIHRGCADSRQWQHEGQVEPISNSPSRGTHTVLCPAFFLSLYTSALCFFPPRRFLRSSGSNVPCRCPSRAPRRCGLSCSPRSHSGFLRSPHRPRLLDRSPFSHMDGSNKLPLFRIDGLMVGRTLHLALGTDPDGRHPPSPQVPLNVTASMLPEGRLPAIVSVSRREEDKSESQAF